MKDINTEKEKRTVEMDEAFWRRMYSAIAMHALISNKAHHAKAEKEARESGFSVAVITVSAAKAYSEALMASWRTTDDV
jgi:hypothetical protein